MTLSFLSLLNQKNFCTFNRALAHQIGLNETIFLHALIAKYDQFKASHPDEEEFYYLVEDAEDDTTLTERQQSRLISNLEKLGLFTKRTKGLPPRRYFTLNLEKIMELIGIQINFPNSDKMSDTNPTKCRKRDRQNVGLHHIYNNKNKNNKPKGAKSTPPSADASELMDFFISKIKETKPDFQVKNPTNWLKEIDLMLRKDGRDPERAKQIIVWLSEQPFKFTYIQSAKKLREAFDSQEMRMDAKKMQERITSNRDYCMHLKDKYKTQYQHLTFDQEFAKNTRSGLKIYLNEEPAQFAQSLKELFGVRHD